MYCKVLFLALSLGVAWALPRPSRMLMTHKGVGMSAYKESRLGIYNGIPSTITKHPYLVGILVNGTYYCTGTIVGDGWVVTLADCTKRVSPSDVTVVAGSTDGVTGATYTVENILPHPYYGYQNLDYDFALINITGTFAMSDVTKKAKLPHNRSKDNVMMTVAGYGTTVTSHGRELMRGNMTWLPEAECAQFYSKSYGITWTDRMSCAYNNGSTTLCKGDFGDPFVKNGVYFGHFIGAAKSGFCSPTAKPVIVADFMSVAPWIRSIVS